MSNYRPIASISVAAAEHSTVERAVGCCIEARHHNEIAHRLARLREGIPRWLKNDILIVERLLKLRD